MTLCTIGCHFVQYKKRAKHPWRSVTFCKVAGFSVTNVIHAINTFQGNFPFLCPLKRSGNLPIYLMFSGIVEKEPMLDMS